MRREPGRLVAAYASWALLIPGGVRSSPRPALDILRAPPRALPYPSLNDVVKCDRGLHRGYSGITKGRPSARGTRYRTPGKEAGRNLKRARLMMHTTVGDVPAFWRMNWESISTIPQSEP
jgi:hypothetical protein